MLVKSDIEHKNLAVGTYIEERYKHLLKNFGRFKLSKSIHQLEEG